MKGADKMARVKDSKQSLSASVKWQKIKRKRSSKRATDCIEKGGSQSAKCGGNGRETDDGMTLISLIKLAYTSQKTDNSGIAWPVAESSLKMKT